MQDLGTHPDGRDWSASSVSGDGSVVVGTIDPNCGCRRASLWTSSLGVVDLNTYLPTLGVDLAGWTLGNANGVSADGLTIAGDGDFNGAGRGWVVTLVALPVLPGDYNNNGSVDAADYAVWRKHAGTTNSLANDPIGGTIGSAHYNLWRANFGSVSSGIGAGGETLPAAELLSPGVPEPTSVALPLCAAAVLCAWRRQRTAATRRNIHPIPSMFVLLTGLVAANAASAAPLAFSFTDPAGDASGSSGVDVLSLLFNFDNATGDFEAHVTGRPYCCRTLDRIFLKLVNPDTGTTAQDPSFFNHTWSVRWYEPDGTTVVTVTGSDPILRAWNAGHRVATSDIPFGNPDGISEFQSTVRTYLAVEEHSPPRLQGYDHIAPTEIATIVPAPPLLGGDYNTDGTVDAADYVVWRKNPGGIYTPNGYNVWRAHFGETSGNGAAFSTYLPIPSSIPEPSSAAFVIPTLVASIFRRRRARALGIGGTSGTMLAMRTHHGYKTTQSLPPNNRDLPNDLNTKSISNQRVPNTKEPGSSPTVRISMTELLRP
jgi:hypothetical protein